MMQSVMSIVGLVSALFYFALPIVVIYVIAVFLRRLWYFLRPRDPLTFLGQRLARGEISEYEYYRLKAVIEDTMSKPKLKGDEETAPKLKNDQIMAISEEGELVPLSESNPDQLKHKAARHE